MTYLPTFEHVHNSLSTCSRTLRQLSIYIIVNTVSSYVLFLRHEKHYSQWPVSSLYLNTKTMSKILAISHIYEQYQDPSQHTDSDKADSLDTLVEVSRDIRGYRD